jgi:hypothetical protein
MQRPARKRETGRLGPEHGVRDGTHGVTERCQSVIVRGQDSFCSRPCPAQVTLTESDIVVRYQKPAHNPSLIAAGYDTTELRIPWLGRKRLQLVFG